MLASVYDDGPLSIQSNFARKHDGEIAALASTGLITSLDSNGNATRQWRITPAGMIALTEEF